MILTYRLFSFDYPKGIAKLIFVFATFYMQTYVGKQNWKKFLAIDFYSSVTQCERKYTAFASKLLQTQTKSIIFPNCNLQQKALYYRLWLFD